MGEPGRDVVIARWGSYHGNTLGALDLSGRPPLRRPYEPWLGRFGHVSAAYPYGAGRPGATALADPEALADELERAIVEAGEGRVAAFVGEPVVGATLAAAVPPDGYWPRIAEVCRRHGVLLIADEVMTGFGRTGRWFGSDHWGLRPDLLVAAKGATSGYWPFGFVAASGAIHAAVTGAPGGFVHGFTYSHSAVGAAVAREVLRTLEAERLVEASAAKGDRLQALLSGALGEHPALGEIRGRGLMVGIELVADRATRAPFPRAARVTEAVVRGARERGVLVYSGTRPGGRHERGLDPARPAVRDHGRGAPAGGRRSSPTRSTRPSLGRGDVGLTARGAGRGAGAVPTPDGARRCPSGASRRGRSSSTGTTQSPNVGLAMFTPPISASRPPNQSCQPQPPPLSARTAAMNRNATPKQNVPMPSTSMPIPAAFRTPGTARAVMSAPA